MGITADSDPKSKCREKLLKLVDSILKAAEADGADLTTLHKWKRELVYRLIDEGSHWNNLEDTTVWLELEKILKNLNWTKARPSFPDQRLTLSLTRSATD